MAGGGGRQRAGQVTFRLVWLPVALVAVALVVLHWTKPSGVYESAWLFLVLNSVFLTALPLIVTYLAVGAYRDSGLLAVLAIGAGMFVLAGSGTLPPLFQQIRDQNANVVMHNLAVLLAALCLFVGSLPAAGAAPLQLPGIVKLLVGTGDQARDGHLGWFAPRFSGRGGSHEKAGGDVVPGVVTFVQGRAVGVGIQAVSRRPEVLIDPVVGRTEPLGVTRRRETAHRLFT